MIPGAKALDGRVYRGSLAYSFTTGPVHVVQLHNHPAYQRRWDSYRLLWSLDFSRITPSLD